MKTNCPNCKVIYNIPDAKIPEAGATVKCKKCNQLFEVKKIEDKSEIDPKTAKKEVEEDIHKERLKSPSVVPETGPQNSKAVSSTLKTPGKKFTQNEAESECKSCKTISLIDYLLDICKAKLNSQLFESNVTWLTVLGNYGLYLAALLGFIYGIGFAIKYDVFSIFLAGLGWVLLVFISQYTAGKLLSTSNNLIKSPPSQLSSTSFLDCLAVIYLIIGLLSFSYYIYIAIKIEVLDYFWMGLGSFIAWEYLAVISMHPKMLNISISKNTNAGEEAIGLLSFFMKGILKLVPIAFGSGILIGSTNLVIAIYNLVSGGDPMLANIKAFTSGVIIITSAVLPFLAFIVFLIYYISIDIFRAILVLPKKLDLLSQITK